MPSMPVNFTHAFADGAAFLKPPAPRTRWAAAMPRLLTRLLVSHSVANVWETFERAAEVGAECRLGPSAWCVNRGPTNKVRLGEGTVCRGILRREDFGDGDLVIGNRVYIGDDCIISCCDRVEIGDLTLVGHGVQIFDNNSHPLDADARIAHWAAIASGRGSLSPSAIDHAPVLIGDRAWVGFGAVVLKGVTVGQGAVVAAASVVTSDVQPYTIVAGNPAVPIRSLE